MSCLHRRQSPPQNSASGGGSLLLGDFSHLCVSLLPGCSGVDFWQVLSLSWGRHRRAVCVMCGPDGEMWAKEGKSLCDFCLGEGRKVKEKEGREGWVGAEGF